VRVRAQVRARKGAVVIDVIVPNWNGMKVLPGCLKSLARQTLSGLRVTVVDNGSQDGSVEYIREEWPKVRIVALPRNLGFCRAVNEGIRRSSADLIALLNNDAEAEPGWLEALDKAAKEHPQAGSFASKVLMAGNRQQIESAGDFIKPDACGANRGRGEEDSGQYDHEEEIFSASAAAALYRQSLFERIGLFDEDFFAYFEDVDLGFRAQRFGWACVFVPRARVVHLGKASRPYDRNWHLKQEFVNSTLCQIKNLPMKYFVRNGRSICLSHLRSLKGLVKEGGLLVLLSSEKDLFRKMPRAVFTRAMLWRASKGRFDRLAFFLPRP
jgi:GT2 family glycosyltransferase